MKYREALTNAINTVALDNGKKILPMAFPYFLKNLCALLVWDASNISDKADFTVPEAIYVLSGKDLLAGGILYSHLDSFLEWLLDEEIEDGNLDWDTIESLSEKWNEFAELQRKRNEKSNCKRH